MPLDQASRESSHLAKVNTGLVWVSDFDASRSRDLGRDDQITRKKLVRSHAAKSVHARMRAAAVKRHRQKHEATTKANPGTHEQEPRPRPPPIATCTATETLPTHWVPFSTVLSPYKYVLDTSASQFEYSVLNRYVHILVPVGKENTGPHEYRNAFLRDWLPVAIGDQMMRMALIVCACRTQYVLTGDPRYERCALQYKAACMHLLRAAIETVPATREDQSTTVVKDTIISTTLQLASDELAMGNSVAWWIHMDAVRRMIKLNGGLKNIKGFNGFLRRIIEALTSKDPLEVAVVRSNRDNLVQLYGLEFFFSE